MRLTEVIDEKYIKPITNYKEHLAGWEKVIIKDNGEKLVSLKGVSEKIITPKNKLIAIASDTNLNIDDIIIVDRENYKELADLIEKEKEFDFENYQ